MQEERNNIDYTENVNETENIEKSINLKSVLRWNCLM